MADWVCADCGTPGAHPIEHEEFGTFAKFDERYTTGYCDACTVPNPKTPRKGPRRTSRLIRADVFDRQAFVTRKEKDRLRELVQFFSRGQDHVELTDKQVVDLVTLYDKHGAPGFYLPDWVRIRAEARRR